MFRLLSDLRDTDTGRANLMIKTILSSIAVSQPIDKSEYDRKSIWCGKNATKKLEHYDNDGASNGLASKRLRINRAKQRAKPESSTFSLSLPLSLSVYPLLS